MQKIPKVIFEDFKLQATIGQWLGIIDSNYYIESNFHQSTLIQKIKQKVKVSKRKLI